MASSNTDKQVGKLQNAMQLAEKAAVSPDVASHLGAFVLYAGVVDFLVIQAARLVEQIMLKGQLSEGKTPSFKPNEDQFFYSNKVSTGRILKGIRKLLPFNSPNADGKAEAARITALAGTMIDDAFAFLNYRNPLLHQIGNPARAFEEILAMVDKAIAAYQKFRESHKVFFEAAAPYRFGRAESTYFYGEK